MKSKSRNKKMIIMKVRTLMLALKAIMKPVQTLGGKRVKIDHLVLLSKQAFCKRGENVYMRT